jgi:hypothetical protein
MSVADKLAGKSAARQSPERESRLKVAHVNVWSAAKVSFVVGCGFAIASLALNLVLWVILNTTGALDQLDLFLGSFSTSAGGSIKSALGFGPTMGFALLACVLNLITVTILGAVTAALYNLSVRIIGGFLIGLKSN